MESLELKQRKLTGKKCKKLLREGFVPLSPSFLTSWEQDLWGKELVRDIQHFIEGAVFL